MLGAASAKQLCKCLTRAYKSKDGREYSDADIHGTAIQKSWVDL